MTTKIRLQPSAPPQETSIQRTPYQHRPPNSATPHTKSVQHFEYGHIWSPSRSSILQYSLPDIARRFGTFPVSGFAKVTRDITERMQKEKSLRDLTSRLLQMQGEERRAEAHRTGLRLAEEFVKEVRTISYLLDPPMLEEMGLKSAIPVVLEGLQFVARSKLRSTCQPISVDCRATRNWRSFPCSRKVLPMFTDTRAGRPRTSAYLPRTE